MTQFTIEDFVLPAAELPRESTLPAIAQQQNGQQRVLAMLDEDDGLFLGYGFLDNCFPYRMQDRYDRSLAPRRLESVVLENDWLRARFLPQLGGRLWSLWDKKAGKELLFCNSVFRPANLAVRNAWFSGGIEWNFGMVGHHPFTCADVFAARLHAPDGTPVLRIYQYERIRACTYQIDFMLPQNSKVLLCRTRIVNPTARTVPVYWWSNTAVQAAKGLRIVTGAVQAYTGAQGAVCKCAVPLCKEGFDCTYPENIPKATDYFWKREAKARGYECAIGADGYGLAQTATDRLRGRKLFVWGTSAGGKNWQRYLTGDGGEGRYVEIQAGLAQTQYECVPMPPHTAWEWMEAYGAIRADPAQIHGSWTEARREAERQLNTLVSQEELENLLRETHDTVALRPAEQLLHTGGGWGALENARRRAQGEAPLSAHLDFGEVGALQRPWLQLLETGRFPAAAVPGAEMLQCEWTEMLEKAVRQGPEQAGARFRLGLVQIMLGNVAAARENLETAAKSEKGIGMLYALAILDEREGNLQRASQLAAQACRTDPADDCMAKEAARLLAKAKRFRELLELIRELPEAVRGCGRLRFACAQAHLALGEWDAAEAILQENGGLVVPDVREGENSVTELWLDLAAARAEQRGMPFDRKTAAVPENMDFRMQ